MKKIIFGIVLVSLAIVRVPSVWAGAGTYYDELEQAGDKTPLMLAAGRKDLEKVKQLIESGADVNAVTTSGASALMYATASGNADIIRMLIKSGAKIDLQTENGSSAFVFLDSIPHKDQYGVAKIFIDAGADVNAYARSVGSDINPPSPAIIAARSGNTDLLRLLISQGIDLNAMDFMRRSVIANAIWNGQTEIVRILLENGVGIQDAYKRDSWEGWPPVKYAWKEKHYDTVYVVHRAKAGKKPLDPKKVDYEYLIDLLYKDSTLQLKYEREDIGRILGLFDASQLRQLGNVIFARHNYAFKSEDLKDYYAKKFPEYRPINTVIKLSKIEKENVAYIRGLEQVKR